MKKLLLAASLLVSRTLPAESPVVGRKPQKERDARLPEGAGKTPRKGGGR